MPPTGTLWQTPTRVVDYLYDVENRWIGENIFTSGGEHETRFEIDGDRIVLEFDKDVVDGNATVGAADLSHRYVWQPDAVDQLMADEQVTPPTTAGKVVWTLGDNQGTIRDLAVTESGVTSVAAHRVFDSYGNLVSSVNPSTGEVAAVACLFGYTGKAFDNATGLQNNVERWYDAKVGRWLSVDPSGFDGGQTNLYVYCGNTSTNGTDPTGLLFRVVRQAGLRGHWYFLVDVWDSGKIIGNVRVDYGGIIPEVISGMREQAVIIITYSPGPIAGLHVPGTIDGGEAKDTDVLTFVLEQVGMNVTQFKKQITKGQTQWTLLVTGSWAVYTWLAGHTCHTFTEFCEGFYPWPFYTEY